MDSSVVWRTEDKDNLADKEPIENHFIIEKLKQFFQSAKSYDVTCSMMAGATKDFLDQEYFNQEWTNNRVKNRFAYYIDRRKNVHLTLQLNIAKARNSDHFKTRMMDALKHRGLFISEHKDGMQDLETVSIGWYQGEHPDVCDMDAKEHHLNDLLRQMVHANKDSIQEWCQYQPEQFLQNWNGEIPTVRIFQVKPFFTPNKKQKLVTRAIGVRGQKRFGKLSRKMLADIDIEVNHGRASFVPFDMLSAGREMREQYGKIITLQQKILRDNDFQTIFGLTQTMVDQVETKILQIPGIVSFHKTRQTISQGKYRLLTQKDLSQARLAAIDSILGKLTFDPTDNPYHESPHRSKRSSEYISDSLKSAWKSQTMGVIHIPTKPMNAWRTSPQIISPQTPKKSAKQFPPDDKSINTYATVSVESDETLKLQEKNAALTARVKKLETTISGLVMNVRSLNAKGVDNKKSVTEIHQTSKSQARDIEEINNRINDVSSTTLQMQKTQHHTDILLKAMDTRQTILENKNDMLEIKLDTGFADLKSQFAQLMNLIVGTSAVPPISEIPTQSKRGSESVSDMTYSQGTPHRQKKQATAQTPPRIHKSKHESAFQKQLSTNDIEDDDPTHPNL